MERLKQRRARVAVTGLGHVGLPTCIRAAAAGFDVTGIDVDSSIVERLESGTSHLAEVADADLGEALESGRFRPSAGHDALSDSHVILICVQTPLRAEAPDMAYIESAAREIARRLRAGRLVILESTTYPGTTEETLLPILETSGLKAGTDFYLGYSPQRIDPGNTEFGIARVPKLYAGIDDSSAEVMQAFYSTFVDHLVRVSSPKAAEMTKLLENTYRHVNIALVNEIAIFCHDLGINVWEVIDAAATKPFGFQPFYPGPGWGGHCIPVDPAFLSWRVRQMGETARFVELAHLINLQMPQYVVQRIGECLGGAGSRMEGASILILGVTYKPDIADTRESPALEVVRLLRKAGAEVSFNDPFVPEIEVDDLRLGSTDLTDEALGSADLVVVLTDHSSYDWGRIARHVRMIFDTRNALRGVEGPVVRL